MSAWAGPVVDLVLGREAMAGELLRELRPQQRRRRGGQAGVPATSLGYLQSADNRDRDGRPHRHRAGEPAAAGADRSSDVTVVEVSPREQLPPR